MTSELGDYRPVVDAKDEDWRPVTYTVHAHHASTLDASAYNVTERKLERLTIVRDNEYDDGPSRIELELPNTVDGLEALIGLLDHARDYLAQENTP